MLCAADIRKHKELIEQYDRESGQYIVSIVEKRAGESPLGCSGVSYFLAFSALLSLCYEP